tara:strand:+ start:2617 stop:2898 length:282 start_codon:yes stop_codon:yes gene_type:complete
MNFNNLPSDIQEIIFMKNRDWTRNEIKKNKQLFSNIMGELFLITHRTIFQADAEIDSDVQHIEDSSDILYWINRVNGKGMTGLYFFDTSSDEE